MISTDFGVDKTGATNIRYLLEVMLGKFSEILRAKCVSPLPNLCVSMISLSSFISA